MYLPNKNIAMYICDQLAISYFTAKSYKLYLFFFADNDYPQRYHTDLKLNSIFAKFISITIKIIHVYLLLIIHFSLLIMIIHKVIILI